MAAQITTTASSTNFAAQFTVDWADGEFYISDVKAYEVLGNATATNISPTTYTTSTSTGSSGVKVPIWTDAYKYTVNDIVAYNGKLYVSQQNNNINNLPDTGTFWWKNAVDLTFVDAYTINGKTLDDVKKFILGNTDLSNVYTKSEVNNMLTTYISSVDAAYLNGWNLTKIQNDYATKISVAQTMAQNFATELVTGESSSSFQQTLVTLFETTIAPENINR